YAHKDFWKVITDKKLSSNTSIAITKISEPLKEKILSKLIRKIQPGQWRDKGEKIHGPDPNVVYWPKNRHWESIKDITEKLYRKKYPNILILLIYRPRDGRKQNCLVQIPSSSEKKELVKNDIEYLPLNTLSDKFLKDILANKKVINWELRYAMTIHTSQGMTFKSPQHVWVIDENLAWDNLIYLTVGHVEYLNQLIRVEAPPLPCEIAQKIEKEKKKKWLEHELRPSIQ
ncbi:31180_t:CDS:2, partial [Racocetra persica]